MKIMLAVIAMLVLLPSLGYALPIINAQTTTVCNGYDCMTTVDMSKYVSGLTLSTAKTTDISKDLPATTSKDLASKIETIAYRWDKDSIIVSGKIKANTYWTLDVAGYTIDPWWNYTTLTNFSVVLNATNKGIIGDAATAGWDVNTAYGTVLPDELLIYNGGGHFAPSLILVNTSSISPTSTVTEAKLQLYLHTSCSKEQSVMVYNSTGYAWNEETITYANMPANNFNETSVSAITKINLTGYYNFTITNIIQGGVNSSRNVSVKLEAYPSIAGCDVSKFYSKDYSGDASKNPNIFVSGYTQSSTSIYYENTLTLNGTQSNITLDNSTALDIVAQTNLTGVNASIYLNGTLKNSTLTSTSYSSNLSAGLYNVTAFYGNTSTNSTLTYWANMTYTPPQPTETEFWLNGTQYLDTENPYQFCSNYEINNVNLTAYTNVSVCDAEDCYLRIFCNDSSYGFLLFSSNYATDLPFSDSECFFNGNGIYNISVINPGNASYLESSQTQWINLTECATPEPTPTPGTSGYVFCSDNNTLTYNNTFVPEIGETRTWSVYCSNGCDTVLNICSPSRIISDIISFGIIISILVFVILIARWLGVGS